jgi:outer membrane protein assembly factor BamB
VSFVATTLQNNASKQGQDMSRITLLVLLQLALFVSQAAAFPAYVPDKNDWPWWRGTNRNGVAAAGQRVPTKWSEKQNVLWKTPLPGRGHSSPTVVGNRIFLATADEPRQIQSVVALDRAMGKPLWQTEISRGGFPKTHRKNTHATCTVACDGERLFVAFHHNARLTLAALDLDGKKVWSKEIGPFNPKVYEYGYAPSPVIYGSTVIVSADYEKGGYIAAYDRETGKRAWQTARPEKLSFSSPVVANVAGRDQLLISGCELLSSYNPKTGDKLWAFPGTTMATCGTMVWTDNLVFASGGYPKAETICMKADGSGEVVWKNRKKCYEQSMLAHDGYIYALTDQGIANCWRASDGTQMWRERLAGPVSASPVLVGDTIYQPIENGTMFVYKANPKKFELVARNSLGNAGFASPTICGNRIYLRTATKVYGKRQEVLYCLGSR